MSGGIKADPSAYELVGITEELHRRLQIQARNLLMEYRLAPPPHRGCVPHEIVEKLMRLYGELIAKEIFANQKRAAVSAEQREVEFLDQKPKILCPCCGTAMAYRGMSHVDEATLWRCPNDLCPARHKDLYRHKT